MAKTTKKPAKSKKKKTVSTKGKSKSPQMPGGKRTGAIWDEALTLEGQLEEKLLADAILSAKLALQELEEETRKAPYERRSGLRLRDKARKSERAFNRLRALRKGELLPECHPDE